MNSNELRDKYLNYFIKKGHTLIPSSSLVPENDPSVLFTTAGMQSLVPYFLGEKHIQGKRLVNSQKCIRTDDINEIGDSVHHTFFEMLGNWSLGDYFKDEAISWSYQFLTDSKWLSLDKKKLAVSVFAGDGDSSFDEESYNKWIELGFSPDKIAKMPKKKNWWGPAGDTGPCGPDTEMFYWTGKEDVPDKFQNTYDNASWVEVWNEVFIQYNKDRTGKYDMLEQKNVDTGMGLERMLAVINGLDDDYKTDLFWPIIELLQTLSGKKYSDNKKEFRIIADHIKAAVFAIGDGVVPSNKGAGYVVRRLIRRAVVKAQHLGISENFTAKLSEEVFNIYDGIYFCDHSKFGMTRSTQDDIKNELDREEVKFRKTLKDGLGLLNSIKIIDGKNLFNLYQTYGIPLEISIEELSRSGKSVDKNSIDQFHQLMRSHQELSRTASSGMFKGGLSDASEETKKLHTAAHLLLESLRRILGDHVSQKGSNITPERLRFDFSHPEKVTSEQLKQVEEMVNAQIEKDLTVTMQEMTLPEAKEMGATGVFENKYGDIVKVYSVGDFSKEICGGPHVENSGELGYFKIIKEESSSSGVRRIKAILE